MSKRKRSSNRRDTIYQLSFSSGDLNNIIADYDHYHFMGELDAVLDIKTQDITASTLGDKNIIIGLYNGDIEIYNLNGQLLNILKGHTQAITGLATFNNLIVSGSKDAIVRIWDSNCIKVLSGNYGSSVSSLLVVEDKILVGFYDGTLKIYDTIKYSLLTTIKVYLDKITDLYLNENQLIISSISEAQSSLDLQSYCIEYQKLPKKDLSIKLQDYRLLFIEDTELKIEGQIICHANNVFLLPTGKVLVFGDGKIEIWK